MSSDSNDIRITQYVFNELDETEKLAFEAEMDQNPELRKLVEQTQTTVTSLKSDFQAEPAVSLTDEQREKITVGSGAADSPEVAPARPLSTSSFVGILALAASLLLIVSLVLYKSWNAEPVSAPDAKHVVCAKGPDGILIELVQLPDETA